MYGPWQWGHMAVTQYPEKHNLIVKAMRKVDPAIKVIASSATPDELSWTYIENRPVSPSSTAPAVSNPMLNPLTNALVYHEFFRHSDMVALGVATGGMRTLAMDAYGDAAGFRMEGLVIKVLHDHFAGSMPVAVTSNSPQHVIKGAFGVDLPARAPGSPTYPLDVFAALSADRKKLAISVVNPTETAQDCELNLTGVQPVGAARLWQLTAPAGAVAPSPAPGPGGFGGGAPATMAESSLPQAPRRITLPPSSLSVYEFEVK